MNLMYLVKILGFCFYTFSTATPSRKYSSRTNAGDSVCTFGAIPKSKWKSGRNVPVDIADFDASSALSAKFKYMFQKLTDKAASEWKQFLVVFSYQFFSC